MNFEQLQKREKKERKLFGGVSGTEGKLQTIIRLSLVSVSKGGRMVFHKGLFVEMQWC